MTDLEVKQLSSIVNAIMSDATGKESNLVVHNNNEFVSVGTTALKVGYDPLINAISQVLSSEIFYTIREYAGKGLGLLVDNQAYGNHRRKLEIESDVFEDDQSYKMIDNSSIDDWKIKHVKPIQFNFYGQTAIQYKLPTIYTHQLDTAFSSIEEFKRFLSMIMLNATNDMTQKDEILEHNVLTSLMASTYIAGKPTQKISLLSEYNTAMGLSGANALTKANFKQADKYAHFSRWATARLKKLSSKMTERTLMYHQKFNSKRNLGQEALILKHTPLSEQCLFLNENLFEEFRAMTLVDAFNKEELSLMNFKTINYWQNVTDGKELKIDIIPPVINADGEEVKDVATTYATQLKALKNEDFVGVLFDKNACGITFVNERATTSAYNGAGEYYNMYFKKNARYYNDYCENCVVITL